MESLGESNVTWVGGRGGQGSGLALLVGDGVHRVILHCSAGCKLCLSGRYLLNRMFLLLKLFSLSSLTRCNDVAE